MDRATAVSYLTKEFTDIATDAKFDANATATAYNTAIDNSLRHLSYQETDLPTANVDQTNVIKYIALLEYFTLKRFMRLYSLKFDVSAGNKTVEASRSQAFTQMKSLLGQAEADLSRLGIPLGGVASFEMGRITTDILEPSTLAEF